MNIRLLFFFLLLIGFTGCESEPEISPGFSEITLTPVVTRADAIIPFQEGQSAGIFAGTANNFDYRNLSYTMKDGQLTANSGTPLKFPDGKDQMALYAYSPYCASNRFKNNLLMVEISSNQQQDGIQSSDVLWGTSELSKSSPQSSISFSHSLVRLIINLTSITNADLSNAKVIVLPFPNYVNLDITTGRLYPNNMGQTTEIVAHRLIPGCYEAIVPSARFTDTRLFRIENGSDKYEYISEYANFEAGKEYTYNLKIFDGDALPFSVELSYEGQKTGAILNVPAIASHGKLVMTASSGYNKEYLRIRSSDGSTPWLYMDDGSLAGWEDRLSANSPQTLYFEENISEASRSIELEFYDIALPQNVYKRLTIIQAGRIDRLELSIPNLNADRYGNEYDVPKKLEVSSNLNWTISSTADWIETGYNNGGLNQTVNITVRENKTGAPRTGTLAFLVNGEVYKEFIITQSYTESSSFTLKYELNLELNTTGGQFKAYNSWGGIYYYPIQVEIYNHYISDFGDATAKIKSSDEHGFVSDFPICNSIKVDHFVNDDYFIYRNYNGQAATLKPGTISISGPGSQGFFRQLSFNLPIPEGVKRTQKVIYNVVIDNITDNAKHAPAKVTSVIVQQ